MRNVLALLLTLVAAVQFALAEAPAFVHAEQGASAPAPGDQRVDRGDDDGAHLILRETRSAQQRTHAPSWSALPPPVAVSLPPDNPAALYLAGLPPAVPRVHVAQRGARSPPRLP